MTRRYIALSDPPKIEIRFRIAYIICDYEGKRLPGHYTQISKEGGWYICTTQQGGHVHIKPAEFLEEA